MKYAPKGTSFVVRILFILFEFYINLFLNNNSIFNKFRLYLYFLVFPQNNVLMNFFYIHGNFIKYRSILIIFNPNHNIIIWLQCE